jgi:hypothetical protein
MHVAILHFALAGDIICERITREQIAIVDQQGVGGLAADMPDECGRAGKADSVCRLVRLVVIRVHMNMKTGRLRDPGMRLTGFCSGRKRMEYDDGRRGRACQEIAARETRDNGKRFERVH